MKNKTNLVKTKQKFMLIFLVYFRHTIMYKRMNKQFEHSKFNENYVLHLLFTYMRRCIIVHQVQKNQKKNFCYF